MMWASEGVLRSENSAINTRFIRVFSRYYPPEARLPVDTLHGNELLAPPGYAVFFLAIKGHYIDISGPVLLLFQVPRCSH
jgi:hypothetical protein